MLATVSMRATKEVYERVRELADKRGVTLVEALDLLIMDMEIDNQNLEEENTKLKEENAELREENAELREENAKLKKENTKMKKQKTLDWDEVGKELKKKGFFKRLSELRAREFTKEEVEIILRDFFENVNIDLRKKKK